MVGTDVGIVCFDWGGVILEICQSWPEAFRLAGLEPPPALTRADVVAPWRAMGDDLHCGRLDDDTFCRQIAAALGLEVAAAQAVHRAWLKAEFPGMPELIDELIGDRRVETGLLSNTSQAHYALQQPASDGTPAVFPAAGRLAHRVASHRVGVVKPAGSIYATFERVSGYRGNEILFFDDLPANVEAATARGWRAHRIDPFAEPARQVRGWLIHHGVMGR